MLIAHLIFIFWCQTQMFSVYSKNKGIGLTVPILLEGSVFADISHTQKQCYKPVIIVKCVFRVRKSVVFVFMIPPTANLPNSIWHPRLPVGWKHSVLQKIWVIDRISINPTQPKKPQHPSSKLYDQRYIKMRINPLINLQCQAHHLSLSVALVHAVLPSIWKPLWA